MEHAAGKQTSGAPAAGGGKPAGPPDGGVDGFMKGLFIGALLEDIVFPYPEMDAGEASELDLVLGAFRRFAEDKIDAVAIDAAARIPDEVIRGLAEMGALGLTIPEEQDGFGMSTSAYCRFMEQVAGHCGATATLIGGHQSLAAKGVILFGTDEQRKRFLPRMASGELVGAFSLSESGAGSDAAALRTVATWDPAEQVYVLNGTKQWCTNGGYCDLLLVFARTPDLGPVKKGRDITAFLVEMTTPGVERGKEEHKMGIRGSSTTDILFQNASVPAANVLGKKGEGLKIALTILNTGRLSIGACCVGAARRMLAAAVAHAAERQQFDTYLKDFELIQQMIAEMASLTYAMESVVYLTAGIADRGGADFAVESAMTKTFCSEGLWTIVNHAVQINGGNGFITEYPYERFLRDCRVNMIFEGTNEIQRLNIAGTGLKAPTQALREEAARQKMGELSAFASFARRLVTREVIRERFEHVAAELKTEAGMVEEGVRALAAASEAMLLPSPRGVAAASARDGAARRCGERHLRHDRVPLTDDGAHREERRRRRRARDRFDAALLRRGPAADRPRARGDGVELGRARAPGVGSDLRRSRVGAAAASVACEGGAPARTVLARLRSACHQDEGLQQLARCGTRRRPPSLRPSPPGSALLKSGRW